MASMKNSVYCRNTLLVTVFSIGIGYGYDLACLNSLVPVIFSIYNTTYYNRYEESIPDDQWNLLLALTMSLLSAGGFFGSISVHSILKFLSRKNALITFHIFRIIGALIICLGCGITGSYEAFLIGRTVIGASDGIILGVTFVYIPELCIDRERGRYFSLVGFGISIGYIFGPVFSHFKLLGTLDRWIGVLAFPALPSVLFLCCVFWFPSSPFSLLRAAKVEAAHKLVRKLRRGNEAGIISEIENMRKELVGYRKTEDVGSVEKDASLLTVLRTKQYRRQFFTVCFLYAVTTMDGINHVIFFSDQILINAGISEDHVTYVTIGLFVTQCFVTFLGHRLLKRYGSKQVLLGSLIVVMISHIITVTSIATRHLSPVARYFSISGLILTLTGHAPGPNLTTFSLLGELTTEPTRATTVNYSGGCIWFFSWVSGFIAPYLDESMGPYAMLFWEGWTIIFLFFTYFFIPCTKGKTVEEIQEFFK